MTTQSLIAHPESCLLACGYAAVQSLETPLAVSDDDYEPVQAGGGNPMTWALWENGAWPSESPTCPMDRVRCDDALSWLHRHAESVNWHLAHEDGLLVYTGAEIVWQHDQDTPTSQVKVFVYPHRREVKAIWGSHCSILQYKEAFPLHEQLGALPPTGWVDYVGLAI